MDAEEAKLVREAAPARKRLLGQVGHALGRCKVRSHEMAAALL